MGYEKHKRPISVQTGTAEDNLLTDVLQVNSTATLASANIATLTSTSTATFAAVTIDNLTVSSSVDMSAAELTVANLTVSSSASIAEADIPVITSTGANKITANTSTGTFSAEAFTSTGTGSGFLDITSTGTSTLYDIASTGTITAETVNSSVAAVTNLTVSSSADIESADIATLIASTATIANLTVSSSASIAEADITVITSTGTATLFDIGSTGTVTAETVNSSDASITNLTVSSSADIAEANIPVITSTGANLITANTSTGTFSAEAFTSTGTANDFEALAVANLTVSSSADFSAADLTVANLTVSSSAEIASAAIAVLNTTGAATFSTDGVNIGAGADEDVDLVTVAISTTNPRVWWDESDNRFTMTHGLDCDAGSLSWGGGNTIADSDKVRPDYAGIQYTAASGLTIQAANIYTLIDGFGANGPNAVSVSDQANNRCTFGDSRVYGVHFSLAGDVAIGGAEFEVEAFEVADASAGAITGISQANPGVVSCDAGHTLSNGDEVKISGISTGMTEANDQIYTVANVAGTTSFELNAKGGADVNTGGYTAWSSGGTLHLVVGGIVEVDNDFPNGTMDNVAASFLYDASSGNHVELYARNKDNGNDFTAIDECHMWITGL